MAHSSWQYCPCKKCIVTLHAQTALIHICKFFLLGLNKMTIPSCYEFDMSFYMLKLIPICKVFLHALNKMTIASCFELFLQSLLLAMWNSWNAMEQNATWIFRQQYGTYFGVHNLWHSLPWQYCPCKKSISQNFYVVYQKLQTNTKAYCAVSRKKGHDDHSF